MSRPLVLLHGFTGSPESWEEVVRLEEGDAPAAASGPSAPSRPSARSSILAPAALGHDGTPGPPDVERFEDELDRLAAVVEAWIESVGPAPDAGGARAADRRPHVAGYSMGGRLALGLLVRHPDLFGSATLIGANPGLASLEERTERVARDETWVRLLRTEGIDTFVAAWEALPLFATQDALPPDAVRRQRRIRRSHDPDGLARSLRVVGLGRMPDYRPALPRVEVPVRLVAGERDARFRALATDMAGRLPRATVTSVPGAGHNVLLERPHEIAALLREDRG